MSHQIPRALVLDSDLSEYTACIRALKVRGWAVEEAPTFDRALVVLTQAQFNFVIQDIQPQDADGMDAWAFIRKLYPGIFGIITTKSASVRTSVNPFAPGILAFMLKPPEAHIVAHLATVALEFQSIATENRRLQSNLVGLSQLTSSLAWSPNREHAIKLALAHLPGIVGTDIAFVSLLDRDNDSATWSEWMFTNPAQGEHLTKARKILFQQLLDRMEFKARDQVPTPIALTMQESDAVLERAALRSVQLTPILVRDVLAGVLVVANHMDSEYALSFMQIQLCNIVAQIVGVILQAHDPAFLPFLDARQEQAQQE